MAKQDIGIFFQRGSGSSGMRIGGLGTGGFEVRPDGRVHAWNLFNGRCTPFEPEAFDFFLRVHTKETRPLYRWLFTGFSSQRQRHAPGLFMIKPCEAIAYRAEFPFIYLSYNDLRLPVSVHLRAWAPFIPRDLKHSSLPGAFFDFTVENPKSEPFDVSLVWRLRNPCGYAASCLKQRHHAMNTDGFHAVRMEGSLAEPEHDTSGCMTMWALPSGKQQGSALANEPHPRRAFAAVHKHGRLVADPAKALPAPRSGGAGWLCLQERLSPGKSAAFHLGLAWYSSNQRTGNGARVGQLYENWFSNSTDVACYMAGNRRKLLKESRLLPELTMASSLPEKFKRLLLDSLSSLSASLMQDKKRNVLEPAGRADEEPALEYSAPYALALFFPALHEKIVNRYAFRPGPENRIRWLIDDCCHVLRTYRDAIWNGNQALIQRNRSFWERILDQASALNGLALPVVGDEADGQPRQTIYGQPACVFLAALSAIKYMAGILGDALNAKRAHDKLSRGAKSFEEMLWGGEHYIRSRRISDDPADETRDQHDKTVMTDLLESHAAVALLGHGFLDPQRVRRHLTSVLDANVHQENACVVNGADLDKAAWDHDAGLVRSRSGCCEEALLALQLYAADMLGQGDSVMDEAFDRNLREDARFDQDIQSGVWGAWLARIGLTYDGLAQVLSVLPAGRKKDVDGLFLTVSALGHMRWRQTGAKATLEIELMSGNLVLKEIVLKCAMKPDKSKWTLNGMTVSSIVRQQRGRVLSCFNKALRMKKGDLLKVRIS